MGVARENNEQQKYRTYVSLSKLAHWHESARHISLLTERVPLSERCRDTDFTHA
jgi:hypothetical protein